VGPAEIKLAGGRGVEVERVRPALMERRLHVVLRICLSICAFVRLPILPSVTTWK
jgi:hypothetical protein